MDQSLSIFNQVQNFGKKQSIRISAEDYDDSDDSIELPDDGRSMTGRYERNKRIDSELMFAEPARRSQEKHQQNSPTEQLDPIINNLLLEHWVMFFNCFREDERDFEQAEFLKHAQGVQDTLNALGPGEAPDLVTQRQMLYLVTRFTKEHFDSRNRRIDELQNENRRLRHQKDSIALSNCLHEDETNICVDIVKSKMDRTTKSSFETKESKPKLRHMLTRLFENSSAD